MVEEKNETKTDAPEVPAEPEVAEDLTVAEIQSWNGFRLDDMGGSAAGKVEGVYVDADSGNPEWILARMGRFGHHCLIPARDAVAAGGHVWVPYTRDQIRKGPKIEAGKPLQRDQEAALLEHYGVGTGEVGRGAELAAHDASAVTARPA
jgi:hypothetical protein